MAAADAGRALFINDVAERRISTDGNLSLEQVEALPCVVARSFHAGSHEHWSCLRTGVYRIAARAAC